MRTNNQGPERSIKSSGIKVKTKRAYDEVPDDLKKKSLPKKKEGSVWFFNSILTRIDTIKGSNY